MILSVRTGRQNQLFQSQHNRERRPLFTSGALVAGFLPFQAPLSLKAQMLSQVLRTLPAMR
jgi:hypothetical protein